MASRGHLGGLAWSTPQAMRVLDAAGCDVVLVETVGVGQSEVEVAGLADTTLVLLAPGMGDGIQAAKAGILEIGDVTWSTRPTGTAPTRPSASSAACSRSAAGARSRALAAADRADRRAAAGGASTRCVAALDKHRAWMERTGELAAPPASPGRRDEIEAIAVTALRARMGDLHGGRGLDTLAAEVVAGDPDPYAAADELVATVAGHGRGERAGESGDGGSGTVPAAGLGGWRLRLCCG